MHPHGLGGGEGTARMLFHDFSDRAEECIRFAQRAKSTHDRDLFMAIARAWYGLDHEAPETAQHAPQEQQPLLQPH